MKRYNFIAPLLEIMIDIIKRNKCSGVVWIGNHPFLPVILDVLFEIGIENIQLVSNYESEYEVDIVPFTLGAKYPDNNLRFKGLESLDICGDEVFLLANTHYVEFAWQLSKRGIKKERIVDLYDYSHNHIEFWKNQRYITKDMYPLFGRELQLMQLDILKQFKDFCEDNNLKYFLAGGTLLGAVRHRGFIPWDDDIDVYMPYEDYIKFIELYPRNEKYFIENWRVDDDYPVNVIQFSVKDTYVLRPYSYGYIEMCLFIDILPLTGYPSDKEKIQEKWNMHKQLNFVWDYYYATSVLTRSQLIKAAPRLKERGIAI